MSKPNEQMLQKELKNNIEESIEQIQNGPARVNQLLRPSLVSCSEKEKTITIGYPVQEWQLNAKDVMHGGMIAAAFDLAMGLLAIHFNHQKPVAFVNLSLNYMRPIPKDDFILITAKATSVGKRLLTVSAECRLKSNGLLTNTAIGTYAAVDLGKHKSNS